MCEKVSTDDCIDYSLSLLNSSEAYSASLCFDLLAKELIEP